MSDLPNTRQAVDPVREQRARVKTRVSYGMRSGTALFSIALTVFFLGLMTTFTKTVSTIILVCIIAGSVALAPALVFHYGVKAADREDRAQGR